MSVGFFVVEYAAVESPADELLVVEKIVGSFAVEYVAVGLLVVAGKIAGSFAAEYAVDGSLADG